MMIRRRRLNEETHGAHLANGMHRAERLESNPARALDYVLGYLSRLTSDDFVISDPAVANLVGRYIIRNAIDTGSAREEQEFVDEVETILSGSCIDGSPFDAADADRYASHVWNNY